MQTQTNKPCTKKNKLGQVENLNFFILVFLARYFFHFIFLLACLLILSTHAKYHLWLYFYICFEKEAEQMTNIHAHIEFSASPSKHITNLICHKTLLKWYIFSFSVAFIFESFINICVLRQREWDDDEAEIKLFGINIFNMWHIQSSFAKVWSS